MMLMQLNHFPSEDTSGFITGAAGKLEVHIEQPNVGMVPVVAVICHPHPQMGGTMNNKVVTTLARSFRELGVTTVRFNFRGIGESEGSFGQGVGEKADLMAIGYWVKQFAPQAKLWLAGFSFGSAISLHATKELYAQLLVSVAPPVHYPELAAITAPDCPWLVIQGEQDEIVNPSAVFDWVQRQQPQPALIKLPNAGHFFHGHLIALRETLVDWLRPYLP